LPDGIEVSISVLPEFDAEVTRGRVERTIRGVLEKLDALPTRVLVRIVDEIKRTGSGAKERLVVAATRGDGS
jgi:phenylacetate-CoA ligase